MSVVIAHTSEAIFLKKLLDQIEQHGLDCHRFRRSYVERRLARRLRATGSENYFSYHRYVERHMEEYRLLINALTVNVTEFFRDAEVYHELETRIIPQIIANHAGSGRRLVRIWSAGCSSGEEVYTVAMVVARSLEQTDARIDCTVYGTDVDDACVNKGRVGVYPAESLKTIPETYQKYVAKNGAAAFTFVPEIQRMTRFKKLDLFADKPIRPVEVILCRNVMIYFDRDQQDQLIDRFYRSITRRGYLIIGKSERLRCDGSAFAAIDARCRIYQKLDPANARA